MINIDRSKFTESRVHRLVTEISDLQLEGFPEEFMIPGCGNGHPFVARRVNRQDGDLLSVDYAQRFGCMTAVILND